MDSSRLTLSLIGLVNSTASFFSRCYRFYCHLLSVLCAFRPLWHYTVTLPGRLPSSHHIQSHSAATTREFSTLSRIVDMVCCGAVMFVTSRRSYCSPTCILPLLNTPVFPPCFAASQYNSVTHDGTPRPRQRSGRSGRRSTRGQGRQIYRTGT